MQNSQTNFLLATTILFAIFFISCKNESGPNSPAPTEIGGEEDGENAIKREAWFQLMHSAAPGVNWEAMEYENQMEIYRNRLGAQSKAGTTEIAGGLLTGEWNERGSKNQAGSVFETEFDQETEEIWVLGAGGTIFKGPLEGQQWEVVNQDIRFNNGLLKFIPNGTGRRLLALANKVPHYSDDDGKTWTTSTGIPIGDRWMATRNVIVLNDSLNTILAVSKPDFWSPAILYKSFDKGETFEAVLNLRTSDFDEFDLCNPLFSNEVYLMEKETGAFKISKINLQLDALEEISSGNQIDFEESRANLAGVKLGNDSMRFVVYAGLRRTPVSYFSESYGQEWVTEGVIAEGPWDVGIYILPSNPVVMFTGGQHLYISRYKGRWWLRKNDWWAYYDDVEGSLHADMMHFKEFMTKDGKPFQLVSNHGGLSISYNEGISFENLGLESLNVSQYYSVRTDPTDPFFIYGGTQDQGFQRANTALSPDLVDFDQIISGDYGHIVFAQSGNRLWTVFPGGSVSVYPAPRSTDQRIGWTLESEDESVWIPPLMPSPDPNENAVYLAGGNMNGGEGSHIIKLTNVLNDINPTQLPFDFKEESVDGEVSAISFSEANTNQWYAATTNGRFFSSEDMGQTWEQSFDFIPEGHFLYGQAIETSKNDPNLVYLAGSGYSNPACFLSTDGGFSFIDMADGLPNTLIFDLAYNEEESLLEYVAFSNTVRFGTYGRGIWDFNIQETTSADEIKIAESKVKVFPNPSNQEHVFIEISEELLGTFQLKITDINGAIVRKEIVNFTSNPMRISTKKLTSGSYFITLSGKKGSITKKLIK